MGYFDLGNFMPHGMCYLWRPELLGVHVFSVLAIALAYFSIPTTIWMVMRRTAAKIPYRWAFGMFAVFIFCCGINHLFNIVVIWYPLYYVEGVLKLLTAAASIATAVLMLPLVPVLINRFSQIQEPAADAEG